MPSQQNNDKSDLSTRRETLSGGKSSSQGAESAPKHAKPEQGTRSPRKKKSVIALSIVLVALLCCVGAGVGYLAWVQSSLDRAAKQAEETEVPETDVEPEEDGRVENPIDFPELKLENADIYAWIYIPNTNINYPVLQSAVDDSFYLTHNVDGDYSAEGAIYSEMANDTDFSDPVTVLYGHNLVNNTMFSTLHYFENEEFFDQNETMYIYTPDRILTYRIVSAYQYDDRHILNSFDFSDPAVVRSYFDYVVAPDSLLVNVREGAVLQDTDKIVQLSTCMSDTTRSNTRYLVTGVLIDEQQTF